ncbi:hypothetical protein FEM48_Zijuj05G0101800 [Ziziphus jujuba var. spinosa]|uniref:non-specific serine/threonine protein kinase n=1 Tax=Ziziphus jujuba var. spinosa TaxID=714518 RepID=A0A978VEC7_ZIZJJ|nr:hypothetical protein FEM48_Zijuj05G0101800 [Ziziphus jujuba var. spinosa]
MKIARTDLYGTLCIENDFVAITLNYTLFDYAPNVENLTLIYGCQKLPLSNNFSCNLSNRAIQTIYYDTDDPFNDTKILSEARGSCKPLKVPILQSSKDVNSPEVGREELDKAVKEGFDVDYNYQIAFPCKGCEGSGGRCGSNVTTNEFLYYCHKSKPQPIMCRPGVTAAAVAIFLACVIICVVRCRKSSTKFFSKMTKSDKDIEVICSSPPSKLSLPMESARLFPLFLHLILGFSIFTFIPVSYCKDNGHQFNECSRLYECGNLTNISYPFWGDNRPEFCGLPGFKLECKDNQNAFIQINYLDFRVLRINQLNNIMTIARLDLWSIPCSPKLINTSLNYSLFNYSPTVQNLTLFYETVYYANDSSPINLWQQILKRCRGNITLPIFRTALNSSGNEMDKVQEALNQGFDVEYKSYRKVCGACEG